LPDPGCRPSDGPPSSLAISWVADPVAFLADASGGRRGAVLAVAGAVGEGKTATLDSVADTLRGAGISVGGVLSPRVVARGETIGYDAVDLMTGVRRPFLRGQPPGDPVGRFFLVPGGLAFTREVIRTSIDCASVTVIDEIGRLELSGAGHAAALREALRTEPSRVIALAVRTRLLPAVIRRFDLRGAAAYAVSRAVSDA
jgi:nucleoside-triphosphatase THEP1